MLTHNPKQPLNRLFLVIEMKDWLLDCCFDDDDVTYIQSCTPCEIEALVYRFYEGGVKAFIASIQGS